MIDVRSEGRKRPATCYQGTSRGAASRPGWLVCAVALAVAGAAHAQMPPQPANPPMSSNAAMPPKAPMPPHPHPPHDPSLLGADVIGSKLFPPDLIMRHQQDLGIDQQQRDAILKEIERAHSQIFPAQWQMSAAAEQLSKALEASKLDEEKVLAQAEKVMALEQDIKRAHLALLIRIRNVLSDAQRAKAAELRGKAGH